MGSTSPATLILTSRRSGLDEVGAAITIGRASCPAFQWSPGPLEPGDGLRARATGYVSDVGDTTPGNESSMRLPGHVNYIDDTPPTHSR